jgi:hypothetical protein
MYLAQARVARDKARSKILEGIDPIEARQYTATAARPMTFDQCAASYIRAHEAAWQNAKHRRQWVTALASYVTPVFGALPERRLSTQTGGSGGTAASGYGENRRDRRSPTACRS